jgi:thiamine-phosphate pyrophosphorylase
MPLILPRPIIYLITSGKTTSNTSPDSEEFCSILRLAEAAVSAGLPLFQIREKQLSARVLHKLVCDVVEIARHSSTRVLVNDRSDVASAAGADGVHLTSHSIPVEVVRQIHGDEFLVGVSTHSLIEAHAAQRGGADLVVFGPVFETESKRQFGEPQGLHKLHRVATEMGPFPVLAIGGITISNAESCFRCGAAGIAAIQLLCEATTLFNTVDVLRKSFESI